MRKRRIGIWLGALALAGCGAQSATPTPIQPDPLPTPSPAPAAGAMVTKQEAIGGQLAQLVFPPGYRAAGSERYPLLVFFHSYARDAEQLTRLTRFGRFASELGWISASADLGGGEHWGNPEAIRLNDGLVDGLVSRYPIDPERIYFVGFSMGGGTALLAAMADRGTPREPAGVASSQGWTDLAAMRTVADGTYAASIDRAYGGDLSDASKARGDLVARASELSGIPVYLEHGDADRYVPVDQSRSLAARLQSLQLPVTLRIFPGLGHGETTLHEGAILDFLKPLRRAR